MKFTIQSIVAAVFLGLHAQAAPDRWQAEMPLPSVQKVDQARDITQEDPAKARFLLSTVVSDQPNYYRARYNLGLLQTTLRQYKEAVSEFEAAAKIRDAAGINDPELPIDLGWAYFLAGRRGDAEAQYKTAWSSNKDLDEPTRRKLIERMAFLYIQGGEPLKLEALKNDVRSAWGDDAVKAIDKLKPIQVVSRPALAGWVYYAFQTDTARGTWTDENFEKIEGSGKVPKKGDVLRCRLTMNVRAEVYKVENGREVWPPIIGSIRANDQVVVEEVVQYDNGPGVHYWIKARRQ